MTDKKKAKRKDFKNLIYDMAEIMREARRAQGEIVPLEVLLNKKKPNEMARICFLNITKAMDELQTFYDRVVNPKMVLFKNTSRDFGKLRDDFEADHKKLDKNASLQVKAGWEAVGKALKDLKKKYKAHLEYVDTRPAKRGVDPKKVMQKLKYAVDIGPYIHEAGFDDEL
jgi:hypothetical protein